MLSKRSILFKIIALFLTVEMLCPLALFAQSAETMLSPKLSVNALEIKSMFEIGKNYFFSDMGGLSLSKKITQIISELKNQDGISQADQESLRTELAYYIEKAYEVTRSTYDKLSEKYVTLRDEEPEGGDLKVLMDLLEKAHIVFPDNINVLDAGTGYRDLHWLSRQNGITAVGIDNSSETISSIKNKQSNVGLDARVMDMTDMDFSDETFEVVRAQASLHHLVLVDEQLGADLAVQEAYRVLKPDGLYYVCVKAASDIRSGFSGLDTEEGLGERFYQFYSKESLRALLERNGFVVLGKIQERIMRGTEKELIAYAQKPQTRQKELEYFNKLSAASRDMLINVSNEAAVDASTVLKSVKRPYVIGMGGYAGVGKTSFFAPIVKYLLAKQGFKVKIIGMDTFIKSPQKRKEIGTEWGPEHVRLDDLSRFLQKAHQGEKEIGILKYVREQQNTLDEDIVSLEGVDILIVEGLYVVNAEERMDNIGGWVDRKIFFDASVEYVKQNRFQQEDEKVNGRDQAQMQKHWDQGIMPDIKNNIAPSRKNADIIIEVKGRQELKLKTIPFINQAI